MVAGQQVDCVRLRREGRPQLSVAPVDGGSATTVKLGDVVALDVSWSPPSGEFLLLRARIQPGETVDLLRVRPDGRGLQLLGLPGQSAFGSGYTLSGSTFAPDGKSIAYNSIETDPATLAAHFRIALVAPDGTGRRTLPGPAESYVQEGWPVFSPDGKWILVHRWIFKGDSGYAAPESWLAVMPADGSAPAHDVGPRFQGGEDASLHKIWSPDGSRIIAETGNTNQVFSIDPVSGASEQLPWTPELPDWQRIAVR